MGSKVRVIINEQHKLLASQEAILNETFRGDWELFPIPADGLNRHEIARLVAQWGDEAIRGRCARKDERRK
jgi:hypothetical protein